LKYGVAVVAVLVDVAVCKANQAAPALMLIKHLLQRPVTLHTILANVIPFKQPVLQTVQLLVAELLDVTLG
jgi:hypothetical protein